MFNENGILEGVEKMEWIKCGLCGEEGTQKEIDSHNCDNDGEE